VTLSVPVFKAAIYGYSVFKNGHSSYFCDYSACCWPILKYLAIL